MLENLFTLRKVTTAIIVLLALFIAWYLFSVYLVSRLDGTGGVRSPQQTYEQYSSEDGVTFQYPDTYKLSSHTNTEGGFSWDTLDLIDKNYVPPTNGEGPVAISMTVFSDAEGLPVEEFVKNEPKTNFSLSADGAMTKGTVGGAPSVTYHYSGLYENDATAVLYNHKVFMFNVSYADQYDQIRADYGRLLTSVQFQ